VSGELEEHVVERRPSQRQLAHLDVGVLEGAGGFGDQRDAGGRRERQLATGTA
jgi:hypothetical protein